MEGLSGGGGGDDDDEGAARGAIEDEDFMANPGESSRLSIRRSLFEVADGGSVGSLCVTGRVVTRSDSGKYSKS